MLYFYIQYLFYYCSPHSHVKHYHIKQNSRGDFFLSEKHCCSTIPELINYHRHNSGGLASRLKASPCDRPVPATAGLSHGKSNKHLNLFNFPVEFNYFIMTFILIYRQMGDRSCRTNVVGRIRIRSVWSGTSR